MRRDGDGGLTKVVAIPLQQGIRTFATGYEIGPQARKMQNLVWQNRLDGRYLGFSRGIDPNTPAATLTDKGDAAHTNQYLLGLGLFETSTSYRPYAMGVYDTGLGATHLGLWDVLANNALHGAATVSITDDAKTERFPAAWAYWAIQGTFYYSHANANGNIRQWNGSVESEYTVLATASATTPQASAMAIHLDRLWMAVPYNASAQAPNALSSNPWSKTLVWFTDPLDPATIRANSFLQIPDQVRCMFRTTVGDLDASAQSHLVFGCRNSIWVLDGDPRAGNAVLRQLSASVGILSATLVAESQYGTFLLATDGELYLLAPGASSMQPIGTGIKNLLDGYQNIPRTTAPSSLLWATPHLYVIADDTDVILTLDLTMPNAAVWTGPHTSILTASVLGAIRVPEGNAAAERLLVGQRGGMNVYDLSTETFLRPQQLNTGYIFAPGHDVVLERVVCAFTRKLSAPTLSVKAYDDRGTEHILSATPNTTPAVTTGSQTRDKVAKTVYRAPRATVRGDFFTVQIVAAGDEEMDLQQLLVEYRVEPKQDSTSAR